MRPNREHSPCGADGRPEANEMSGGRRALVGPLILFDIVWAIWAHGSFENGLCRIRSTLHRFTGRIAQLVSSMSTKLAPACRQTGNTVTQVSVRINPEPQEFSGGGEGSALGG